jgi:hypothetical protein
LQNLNNCEIAIHNFRIRRVSERDTKRIKKYEKDVKNVTKKENLSSKYKKYQIYMEIEELKIINKSEDFQIKLN